MLISEVIEGKKPAGSLMFQPSPGKVHHEPTPRAAVQIYQCRLFKDTFETNYESSPQLRDSYLKFIQTKMQNVLQDYGKRDYALAGEGNYGKRIPGLRHAHLTHDISIFYSISGTNPKVIKLYAVLTHDQAGTGDPANINKQKNMADKFVHQTFEPIKE